MTDTRIQRLRERLANEHLSGALVLDAVNVGYLSGFTGSTAALVVTAEAAVFITDSRYRVQAARECPELAIAITEGSAAYADTIADQVRKLGVPELAFESEQLSVAQHQQLAAKMPGIMLRPISLLVTHLRRVKDAAEIKQIEAACALADAGFEFACRELLRPGRTEREVATELEFFLRRRGSEREAFEMIVASGARSAMPHGRASHKALEAGDFVTLDFGAVVGGYCSDLTRTVVLGPASDRQRAIYGVVLEAQRAAIRAVRAGAPARSVDAAARGVITDAGFGEQFGHGTGHGLGLVCHDHPGPSTRADFPLEAGMVLTIEPGVYVDGWGGVRIEDDVLVTPEGCEVLTSAPKELLELPVST